jgi:hypothetical protein
MLQPLSLPAPWDAFLEELDSILDEPIELHCIDGFAVMAGYGFQRGTNDLDYRTLVPYSRINDLQRLAGPGSALFEKYKVFVQHPGVEVIPDSYDERLTEICPGRFKRIRLLIPDPYDLVLSKLSRNIERDRQDVEYLARTERLSAQTLRARYEKEMRPNLTGDVKMHDQILEFWIEDYFGKQN